MPVTSMAGHGYAPGLQKEGQKERPIWPDTANISISCMQSTGWERAMKSIERRLNVLESVFGQFCPRCRALDALGEDELDRALIGHDGPELPEPSPTCPDCQKLAAMSEAELDARIARLQDILRKAI
jgi:hypothetical protein